MAVEKGKVLTAIEAKFKGKSLTKNFKENLAAKWAEKIDTDEDIDAYVDDREDVVLEASSEADRRATAAVAKAKEEAGKTTTTTEVKEEVKVDDDAPAWAKALIKQNETLTSKIEAFESKQKVQSITERFNSDPRVKDIPEMVRKGYMPTSDDDFETNVETLVGDYKVFAEKHKLAAHGNDTPGSGNGSDATKTKQVSDADAKDMAKALTGAN